MTSILEDVRNTVADRAVTSAAGVINSFAYPPASYLLPAFLVEPAPDTYNGYHRTLGPSGLMEINLVGQVIVSGNSQQSASIRMDEFLSSGNLEDLGLADAITGNDVTIGSAVGSIYVGEAVNWRVGTMEIGGATVPTVACDLPITVNLYRSVA